MLTDINEKYSNLSIYVRDIWNSKHIIYVLFRNNTIYSHKKKYLGNFWFLLDPLFQLFIWMFIFKFVFRVKQENFALFLFSAISLWSFISNSWSGGCGSISGMGNFLLEVNLPGIALPLHNILTCLYYFAIQMLIILVMLVICNVQITRNILYLPLVLLVMLVMGLGGSMLFAVLGLYIPDFSNLLSHLLRIWWFLSPGIYSITRIPERYRGIFQLNPMCGMFQSFRNVMMYGKPPNWETFTITMLFSVLLLISGFLVFYRREPQFTKLV